MAKVIQSLFAIAFLVLIIPKVSAQTRLQKMYEQKKYAEIVAQASNDNFTGLDYFVIGQSFLKLKDSPNALLMFDKAIAKGYRDGELYFAKGISESNAELYRAAQKSFHTALTYMPDRKKVVLALASAYYDGGNLDSALALNQRIEQMWGDYYPAFYMTCKILFEQEKPQAALDCYYQKLQILKRDDVLYKKALEDIVRLEWQTFKNYGKAEIALKNLIESSPDRHEYSIMLMQLYNTMGRYAEAATLEDFLIEVYHARKLSQRYYDSGSVLTAELDTSSYIIEVFRNFQPDKKEDCIYSAFIFNRDTSRPLGKITLCQNEGLVIRGYRIDEGGAPFLVLPTTKSFQLAVLGVLFMTEDVAADENDSEQLDELDSE